jgi:hypothetical protein
MASSLLLSEMIWTPYTVFPPTLFSALASFSWSPILNFGIAKLSWVAMQVITFFAS